VTISVIGLDLPRFLSSINLSHSRTMSLAGQYRRQSRAQRFLTRLGDQEFTRFGRCRTRARGHIVGL
jgi:hypothetical protein